MDYLRKLFSPQLWSVDCGSALIGVGMGLALGWWFGLGFFVIIDLTIRAKSLYRAEVPDAGHLGYPRPVTPEAREQLTADVIDYLSREWRTKLPPSVSLLELGSAAASAALTSLERRGLVWSREGKNV